MKSSIEYQCYCKEINETRAITELSFTEVSCFFAWYKDILKEYTKQHGYNEKTNNKLIQEWLKTKYKI